MSALRVFLVIVLVGLLAAAGWFGFRIWQKSQPQDYWTKAQEALAAKDYAEAKIYLANTLKEDPDNGEAHKEMVSTLLELARKDDPKATLASTPGCMDHLKKASELLPNDVAVQRRWMRALLAVNDLGNAVAPARRVAKADEKDRDALFVLAWKAVEQRNAPEAEEWLKKLGELTNQNRVFQTFALQAQLAQQNEREEDLQKVLASAAGMAVQLKADQWKLLSNRDIDALPNILATAVAQAPDVEIAHKRAEQAFTAFATLAESTVRKPADLAAGAAQVMFALDAEHPLPLEKSAVHVQRQDLAQSAETYLQAAIDDKRAEPVVYRQLAAAAFARGENERGLSLIDDGLKAGEALPADRQKELLLLHELAARHLLMIRDVDRAEQHLKPLRGTQDKQSQGWAALVAGQAELRDGRLDKALEEFLRAETSLGRSPVVQVSLAHTYLTMKNWKKALPYLTSLLTALDKMDAEQKSWFEQHFGSAETVQLKLLQARLGLNEWDKAQKHAEALAGTQQEPLARLMNIAYLWTQNDKKQAAALLQDSRRKFPRDVPLATFELALLQAASQVQAADELVEQFAAAARDDLDAQLLRGKWLIARGKPEEALAKLAPIEAALVQTPAERMKFSLVKATALLQTGQAEEAMQLMQPLAADPETASGAGLIGAATALEALRNNDPAAAEAAIKAGLKADPRSGMLALLRAQVSASQGDYEAAVASLSGSLDVAAVRDQVRNSMLRSLVQMAVNDSPKKAEAKVDELLVANPEDPVLHIAKAEMQFLQNRFDAGMAKLDELEQLQPKSSVPHYLKATALLQRDRSQDAIDQIKIALEKEPDSVPSRLLAAQIHLAARQYTDALRYAAEAVKKEPRLWQAALVQAEAYKRLVRLDEAKAVLEDLVKQMPRLPQGYLALAALHQEMNKPDLALEVFEAGRKALPEDLFLLAGEVQLLAEQGQLEEAGRIGAAGALNAPPVDKALAVGQAFTAAKQYDLAREWGNQAMSAAKDEQKASVDFFLGNLDLIEGLPAKDQAKLAAARDHFAAVIEVNPRHYVAGNNLAWLLATQFNQPAEAIAVAKRVQGDLSADALPVDFVDTLAEVYRQAGQLDDAQKVVEQALSARENEPRLLFQLGMVLAKLNKTGPAKTYLEKAKAAGLTGDQLEQATATLKQLSAAGA